MQVFCTFQIVEGYPSSYGVFATLEAAKQVVQAEAQSLVGENHHWVEKGDPDFERYTDDWTSGADLLMVQDATDEDGEDKTPSHVLLFISIEEVLQGPVAQDLVNLTFGM